MFEGLAHYMGLVTLTLGALVGFLGIFTLIAQRVPRWLPAGSRRAHWKPYAWAQIFTFAWMTTMFLPQVLDVDPLLGLLSMVPAICFLVTSWVFYVMAFRSPGPK
ncbi:hypothetical protein ABZ912_56055 [Nonomuraea angiospora]|uniref:hypothetical protein n=1 Tax=Nonomuraea angiospora TaxID=46172 RepID=UPI003401E33C